MGAIIENNQSKLNKLPNDWEVKKLGEILKICHGKSQKDVVTEDGAYPVLATGGQIGKSSRALYSKPSVLIGRKGTIDQPQYMDTPFWTVDTLFYSTMKEDNDAKFFYYKFCTIPWKKFNEASGVPSLNARTIENIDVVCPKPKMQKIIANVLSDVDMLLERLEQLIVKKENVKQATMYQLLSDEIFTLKNSNDWKEQSLKNLANITKGHQLDVDDTSSQEKIPHYNGGMFPSSYTNKSNREPNTIAISEGGNSCGYVQIINEPFWCGGHCYTLKPLSIDNNFLFYALKHRQNKIMKLRVGSGLPNIQKNSLAQFKLRFPVKTNEQKQIAEILLNMDKELNALKLRRDKTLNLKQAMMHELLSGKTCLSDEGI